jgi:hypothetical protein
MRRQRRDALHQPDERVEQVREEDREREQHDDVPQQVQQGEHDRKDELGQRHARRARIQSEPIRHESP